MYKQPENMETNKIQVNLSVGTIRRIAKAEGIRGYRTLKKPLISSFCRSMLRMPDSIINCPKIKKKKKSLKLRCKQLE